MNPPINPPNVSREIPHKQKLNRKEFEEQRREIREREKRKFIDQSIVRQERAEAKKEKEEKYLRVTEIDEINKAEREFAIDPREYVVPSVIYHRGETGNRRNEFDDVQFDIREREKFGEHKISHYIDVMFDFFDITPYYEKKITIRDKNTVKVDTQHCPNDFPTFYQYGYELGLTLEDIEKLREMYPRFNHAYKLCEANQQRILVINMLNGLYKSQTAIFLAKTLFGWKIDEKEEETGETELRRLIKKITTSKEEDDEFIVSMKPKKENDINSD